jgi:hypothetical protein
MVSPTATGRGVGLNHRVLEVAAEDEYAAMQLNAVVETNEHAIRLQESLGSTTTSSARRRRSMSGRSSALRRCGTTTAVRTFAGG